VGGYKTHRFGWVVELCPGEDGGKVMPGGPDCLDTVAIRSNAEVLRHLPECPSWYYQTDEFLAWKKAWNEEQDA